MYYSDLHIHSHYSRATSKDLTFPSLTAWGLIKGLSLIGTGDILHAKWQQEFLEFLTYDNNTGFYKPKNNSYLTLLTDLVGTSQYLKNKKPPSFIPTVETSHIYKDKDKVRRVHLVTIFKTIEHAQKLSLKLADMGFNLKSDGRPIMGISSKDYLQLLLNLLGPENFELVPAHIWTPWYAIMGSKSGYNSIEQAFEDLTPYIHALETGLSSDPKMNRLIKDLDKFILISNSDAHSSKNLGREANIHKELKDIISFFEDLRYGKNLIGTIEFYPEEGRYFFDGHRKCNISIDPRKNVNDNLCPKCKHPLTLGVLNQIIKLANGNISPNKNLLEQYKSFYTVPLINIISQAMQLSPNSKKVKNIYFQMTSTIGPELDILLTLPINNISKNWPLIGCLIQNMRNNNLDIVPGYDGVYGKVKIKDSNCFEAQPTLI